MAQVLGHPGNHSGLRQLARKNCQTLRYYVGKNAKRTASVLWEQHQKVADQRITYTSTYTSDFESADTPQTPLFQ